MNRPRRNVMLTIAYDGTSYCGWQIQPDGPTVQQCVETAIQEVTGVPTRVLVAGRTDAGVHALGQVACFDTDSNIQAGQFRRALQRFLPDDIVIVAAQDVAPWFHATFSAVRKTYQYLIYDGPVMPPFLRDRVCRWRKALDAAAMNAALPALLGTHDFRCFETNYPNKATSVRTVERVTLERCGHWDLWNSSHEWQPSDPRAHEDPSAPLIRLQITADGFLYNMVRAIVGTLIRIGTGRQPAEYLAQVIESKDRGQAGSTAPPSGLYLQRVEYPDDHLTPPDP